MKKKWILQKSCRLHNREIKELHRKNVDSFSKALKRWKRRKKSLPLLSLHCFCSLLKVNVCFKVYSLISHDHICSLNTLGGAWSSKNILDKFNIPQRCDSERSPWLKPPNQDFQFQCSLKGDFGWNIKEGVEEAEKDTSIRSSNNQK